MLDLIPEGPAPLTGSQLPEGDSLISTARYRRLFWAAFFAISTVALAPVSLGTRQAELVEVSGGLEAGQTVIRSGHQKLFPGARVMPVGSDATPAGAGS